ncbi:MAG: hypothetical protein AMXMBFR8_14870 [Nevskiales bacterium]
MARYEHLPIYKQALDAAVHFEKVVAGFSRYHKYTLGTEIRSQSRAALALIVRANGARDRASVLVELRQCLDELLILLRLAKEVRAFRSFSSFQYAIEKVVSVSRQNEGWLRSSKGKSVREPESP